MYPAFALAKPPILRIFFNRSWRLSGSPGSLLSKLTLRAIRMRSWLPTISLRTATLSNSCISRVAVLGNIVSLLCLHYVLDFVRPVGSNVQHPHLSMKLLRPLGVHPVNAEWTLDNQSATKMLFMRVPLMAASNSPIPNFFLMPDPIPFAIL